MVTTNETARDFRRRTKVPSGLTETMAFQKAERSMDTPLARAESALLKLFWWVKARKLVGTRDSVAIIDGVKTVKRIPRETILWLHENGTLVDQIGMPSDKLYLKFYRGGMQTRIPNILIDSSSQEVKNYTRELVNDIITTYPEIATHNGKVEFNFYKGRLMGRPVLIENKTS